MTQGSSDQGYHGGPGVSGPSVVVALTQSFAEFVSKVDLDWRRPVRHSCNAELRLQKIQASVSAPGKNSKDIT